jgi:hypothetical protein
MNIPKQPQNAPFIPRNALQLSRKMDKYKPLMQVCRSPVGVAEAHGGAEVGAGARRPVGRGDTRSGGDEGIHRLPPSLPPSLYLTRRS